jgi:zinc transporter
VQSPLPRIDTIYGSDQNGLVWGYHFKPQQVPVSITSAQALTLLAAPGMPEGEFLWLHFSLSNSSTEPWLKRNLNLPEAFYDSLHSRIGSTRLEVEADSLVAVIHDVQFDFSFDVSSVTTAILAIDPGLLVSVRLRPLRSVDLLRSAVRANHPFGSTAQLLAHLLLDQAGVLIEIVRDTAIRADQIEDRLLANRIATSRGDLGALRRVLVRLQRLLAPEPAALFRMLHRPPGWITGDDIQGLQQAAEEFSAAVGDSTAMAERLKLLQEELTALVTEQTNRTLFVLTLVTVLALPINLVAGLFGMNVGGIPFSGNVNGFFIIIATLLGLTSVLAYVFLLQRKN